MFHLYARKHDIFCVATHNPFKSLLILKGKTPKILFLPTMSIYIQVCLTNIRTSGPSIWYPVRTIAHASIVASYIAIIHTYNYKQKLFLFRMYVAIHTMTSRL